MSKVAQSVFADALRLAHGISNFFVLAPNLTIYNKLITDFTPNTPKYVFRGVAEFATEPPTLITGDDCEQTLLDWQSPCRINIVNISKINSEVRGGRSPRIKRLSEHIGESYFEYLANLPDLALIMDESHRYRASAGVKAINELKPILGLELTATPVHRERQGARPVQERHLQLSPRKGHGGGVRQGARRRHAAQFLVAWHVHRSDREDEAPRRRAVARGREGRTRHLSLREDGHLGARPAQHHCARPVSRDCGRLQPRRLTAPPRHR